MKNKIFKISSIVAISILVGVTAVYATSKLTPPGTVSNTMYTLTDIYNLANGTTTTERSGSIDVTPALGETGKTLTEVYTAIKDQIALLSPDKIKSGTTVFGITGTLAGAPAPLVWQDDPALNLCWSNNQYEIDNGCSVGSGFTQTPDTLTTLGAVEYCKYLNDAGTALGNTEVNIWHLPTITEYQSITDFTTYNNATQVPGFAQYSSYWSSSEFAEFTNGAWLWGTYDSSINYNDKSYQNSVRCVR